MHENNISGYQEKTSYKLVQNQFIQALMRTGLTTVIGSTILFPFDLYKSRFQAGIINSFSLSNPLLLGGHSSQLLVMAFLNSIKQGMLQNGLRSNQDTINNQFDSVFNTKPVSTLTLSACISLIDTLLTQYHSNRRILYELGMNPVIQGTYNKLVFTSQGMVGRGSRNFINTLFCLSASTTLSDWIEPYLSRKVHPFAHATTTSLIASLMAAGPCGIFDRVSKIQMRRIDTATLKVPSFLQIMRELWQKEGYSMLRHSYGINCGYIFISFSVIQLVSCFLENKVFKTGTNDGRNSFAKNNACFFKPRQNSVRQPVEETAQVHPEQAPQPVSG
ncbi:hypothetical protein ACFORL_11230 [Legionella dresdenensis]|uniref:Carrier protein n=1 Tax=Legionella dresdenensis TaxID=450200 RepID=A0ABV8CHQ6_9GAMM